MQTVCFTGPHKGNAYQSEWITPVVAAVLAHNKQINVGCALGVDAQVITKALQSQPKRLTVYCSYGASQAGFIEGASADFSLITCALEMGATVNFWAGGGPGVVNSGRGIPSPGARLIHRSLACVKASNAIIGFVDRHPPKPFDPAKPGQWPSCGSGTWGSLAAAALLDMPVLVFPANFRNFKGAQSLPTLPGTPGKWQPAAPTGLWANAWKWIAQ